MLKDIMNKFDLILSGSFFYAGVIRGSTVARQQWNKDFDLFGPAGNTQEEDFELSQRLIEWLSNNTEGLSHEIKRGPQNGCSTLTILLKKKGPKIVMLYIIVCLTVSDFLLQI